jgi:hypothetical protein
MNSSTGHSEAQAIGPVVPLRHALDRDSRTNVPEAARQGAGSAIRVSPMCRYTVRSEGPEQTPAAAQNNAPERRPQNVGEGRRTISDCAFRNGFGGQEVHVERSICQAWRGGTRPLPRLISTMPSPLPAHAVSGDSERGDIPCRHWSLAPLSVAGVVKGWAISASGANSWPPRGPARPALHRGGRGVLHLASPRACPGEAAVRGDEQIAVTAIASHVPEAGAQPDVRLHRPSSSRRCGPARTPAPPHCPVRIKTRGATAI